MRDPAAEGAGWRLEIADGPNAGATVVLAPGHYRLGSDAFNDIVLADPAVAAEQATMEFTPDHARIMAIAPGVQLRRRRLDNGRHYTLKPGIVMTLGSTHVRLAGPPGAARLYRRGRLATCLAVLAIACTWGAYDLAAPRPLDAARTDQTSIAPVSSMTLAQAAAAFRTHLSEMHAVPGVTVRASDNTVLATGTILPLDRPAWLDARKWFDQRLGARHPLADEIGVAPTAELPKLDVAAVSMMPIPSVITRDGERYTVGAVLPGGWSIAGIAANAITLRSGTREIRIDL